MAEAEVRKIPTPDVDVVLLGRVCTCSLAKVGDVLDSNDLDWCSVAVSALVIVVAAAAVAAFVGVGSVLVPIVFEFNFASVLAGAEVCGGVGVVVTVVAVVVTPLVVWHFLVVVWVLWGLGLIKQMFFFLKKRVNT